MKNNNSLGIVVSPSRCSCIYRHVASFKRSVTYVPFVQRRHTCYKFITVQHLIYQRERNSCQSERPFYSTAIVVTFKDHCAFDVGHSFRSIVLSLSLSLLSSLQIMAAANSLVRNLNLQETRFEFDWRREKPTPAGQILSPFGLAGRK